MSKVYKLAGEHYEICEDRTVYGTYEKAKAAIKEWEPWLGMSTEEALESEDVIIEEVEVR